MSIDKFLSILRTDSLYFPNIYLFNDKSEGTLTNKSLKEVYKTNLFKVADTFIKQDEAFIRQKDFIAQTAGSHTAEQLEDKIRNLHSFYTLLKEFSNYFMFCSCWFKKEHESFTMWGEYGDKRHATSIALQTTIGDLIDSLEYAVYDVHIGKINYKDYITEHIDGYEDFTSMDLRDPDNVLKLFYAPILHKRRMYDDEHEVRATISFESICAKHLDRIYTSEIPFYSDRLFRDDSRYFTLDTTNLMEDVPDHILIRINLKKLIKAVVISPNAIQYYHLLLLEQLENKDLLPKLYYSDR